DKSGSWYSYQDERIGQGRENAKRFLKDHPEMTTEIDQKVRMGFGLADIVEDDADANDKKES
ncbi:MAG: DNA recombination/repair protein RecA, partial [Desulfocapsa sp.]